jgi:ABC-type glycerol-3-phosphate transport system permease component
MEPEVAAFLKRILTTIGIVLFWMGINSTFGIMFGYAFIESNIKTANVIFYIWLILSIPLILIYLRRLWKDSVSLFYKEDSE